MNESFFEAMEHYNPFCIKDAFGRVKSFKTYEDAYLDILKRMLMDSPRGYLDVQLFLTRHCGLSNMHAADFIDNFYKEGALRRGVEPDGHQVVMIDWSDEDWLRGYLPKFMRSLHWLLETHYDSEMFGRAFDKFYRTKSFFDILESDDSDEKGSKADNF